MSVISSTRGNPQFSDIAAQDATPMIGGASREDGQTILNNIDDELAKLFEDRNVFLADGGVISYNTGAPSTLSTTATFKLHINSQVAGGSPTVITLSGTSFAFSGNGRMLYVVANRGAGTATVFADQASLPAVTSADQEVFLIAKRMDGATERVYLRNGQGFGDGDSALLGSSAVTPSFSDSSFAIFDNGDSTKIAKFEVSGITTATTRTFTVPNVSSTLAVLGLAQTFTDAQTIQGSADTVQFKVKANGTQTSAIQQITDSSDNLIFQVSSLGASTLVRSTEDGLAPQQFFVKTRGTLGSPTVVANDDELGVLRFYGQNAGAGFNIEGARISAVVDGEPATAGDTTDMPGRLVFYTTPNGGGSPIERMRIDNAGVVTIGTSGATPTHLVNGYVSFNNDGRIIRNTVDGSDNGSISINGGGTVSATRGGQINVYGNEHASFPAQISMASGNSISTTATAYNFTNGSGTVIFRITHEGATHIGNGTIVTSRHRISHDNAAGSQALDIRKPNVAVNTNNNIYVAFSGTSGDDGYIQTNGSAVLGITDVSDVRLKTNIRTPSYGLETIAALRPVEFDWIDGPINVKGFIAQEVKEVLPESVTILDKSEEGSFKDFHYLEMQTMIPVLVKAMQESDAQFKELKQQFDDYVSSHP